VSADRPINADVDSAPEADAAAERGPEPAATEPAATEPAAKPEPPEKPSPPPPRHRRRAVPGAIKLVVALVVIAIGFIVLAVVAGSGGSKDDSTTTTTAAAPAAAPPIVAPAPASEEESSDGGEPAQAPSQSAEELGYPSFATDNTTRVGGADPATIAAASALAVFPSTTPQQRPAAVTVVEEHPRFAIPAAVMMAPPVRAPILFAAEGTLPATSVGALEALGPEGTKATGGASVFAIGSAGKADITTAGGIERSKRFEEGASPAGAVAAIARLREEVVGEPPAAYLLAPLADPEIAAPAAAWAARSGDPVLDAGGDTLPPETAALLEAHKKVPAFVLGPASAISAAEMKEVAKLGNPVKRVAGKDPAASALAFARYGSGKFGWNVNDPGHGFVLARAEEPLAAAAASALSASGTWGPLLLTDSADTLPSEVREYFLDVKPGYTTDPTRAFYNHVWVIGDQEAIDVKQQAEVNELAELAKIGEGTEG
jgi:hypothetical protein